jgi:putative tryptophan/tyrosine transport system permease protein
MVSTLTSWLEVGFLVGVLYSPVTIGLAWAFRILNYPDLTCEGTFILSGAVSIVVLNSTGSVVVAFCAASLCGILAGVLTGCLHVYLRVSRLLSGIISWAILYSLTIRVLGGTSSLRASSLTLFKAANSGNSALVEVIIAVCAAGVLLTCAIMLGRSRWGRVTRAAGDQSWFTTSLGYSPVATTLGGLAVANAFIGFGGGLICHHRGVCDVSMGTGLLVAGLASMVLGEAVFNARHVWQHMIVVVAGTVLYNLAISAFYFDWGIGLQTVLLPSDVRFVSGLLLLIPAAIVARRSGRYRLFASEW